MTPAAVHAVICIHLVDDNASFRDSTAWLLETFGFTVIAYESAPNFLDEFPRNRVRPGRHCLVSDIRMPEMTGIQLQEELNRRGVRIPMIFITAHGDVPLAVQAMQRGAANFLEKPFSDEALVGAINEALSAHPAAPAAAEANSERLARLSPRERQVLDLVVAAKPNKIIADVLGISVKTVELHRANMMSKLGVRTLPDLMKVALGHD